jgi:hypothetical protein
MLKNYSRITLLLPAILLAARPAILRAGTFFVSTGGNDAATGSSRTEAFATIGKGVEMLKPGDTPVSSSYSPERIASLLFRKTCDSERLSLDQSAVDYSEIGGIISEENSESRKCKVL